MKKLLTTFCMGFTVLFSFAKGTGTAVEATISKTSTKAEIKAAVRELKKNHLVLSASKIKRDHGNIQSLCLKLSSPDGKVQGSYSDFTSIRIFRTAEGQFGISPVK
jgi:hypothetical protein